MTGFLAKILRFLRGGRGTTSPAGPPRVGAGAPASAPRPLPFAPPRPQPAAPPLRPTVSPGPDAYAAGEILGLSADELRRRALKIDPYKTAWIGRVDTIPPQSDERTALIDRGLVLRGFLNTNELAEIHRVGDLWLRHHDAVRLAETLGRKAGAEAVEQLRRERAERKERKRAEAAERTRLRAEAVARRKSTEIDFLGRGVSSGLVDRRSNVEKLTERGLPVLSSPADVATALGVSVPRLRWLAMHTEATERPHYIHFEIEKKSGGRRLLAAPHKELASAQRWILEKIVRRVPPEEAAHGFVPGRSTVTNALPHSGSGIVVNLDMKDFFPTITFPRVRGLFRSLGYSPAASTLLALLSTEPPRRPVRYDGRLTWVAVGDRALPQGACTSPDISNLVTRRLDRRLEGMAAKHGWRYTRYADDLTFSRPPGGGDGTGALLARVRHIVTEEGLNLHPEKRSIRRSSRRQLVTGLVVNAHPAVPRTEVRRLRAILHDAAQTGLEAQNREKRENFQAWLEGRIAYVSMVDPAKGERLRAAFLALPEAKVRAVAVARSPRSLPPTLPPESPAMVALPQPAPSPAETLAIKGGSGSARHFEFVGGGSSKFWTIAVTGDAHLVRFGRIGTQGQEKTKRFGSLDEAQRDADRLIREKTAKGYIEKSVS